MVDEIVIGDTLPPEAGTAIGPGPKGATGKPPTGCTRLSAGDFHPQLHNIAVKFLKKEWGTLTPFRINQTNYMARVEPHYRKPTMDAKLLKQRQDLSIPEGWHKGVTVYKVVDKTTPNVANPIVPASGRSKFLDRLTKLLQQIEGGQV